MRVGKSVVIGPTSSWRKVAVDATQCSGDPHGRTSFGSVDMVEGCLLTLCLSWVGSCWLVLFALWVKQRAGAWGIGCYVPKTRSAHVHRPSHWAWQGSKKANTHESHLKVVFKHVTLNKCYLYSEPFIFPSAQQAFWLKRQWESTVFLGTKVLPMKSVRKGESSVVLNRVLVVAWYSALGRLLRMI